MTDFSDLPEPARRHLTTAAREVDRLSDVAGQIPDLKTQAKEALPGPLADALCGLLDAHGAALQDSVQTSRANLANIADIARAEAEHQERQPDEVEAQ